MICVVDVKLKSYSLYRGFVNVLHLISIYMSL